MEPNQDSRIERRKEEMRNKIINTAVGLFNQRGLDKVTMEQIAEEADIARGTLYNHFPSKEAVINAYIQRSFSESNVDRIARLRSLPDTRTRLTQLLTTLVTGVQRQKQLFESFMVYRMKQVISFDPPAESEKSGLSELIHEIITLGLEANELRRDLPVNMLEELVEFILIEAIKPLYLAPGNYDSQQSIQNSVDLFMRGAQAV